MRKKSGSVRKIIVIIIWIVLLYVAYKAYSLNNFNDYIKAEYNSGISTFGRDADVKYSKMNSYKIENTDYNDAMFYKTITVVPNTSYRVTCMIKTQNVENKNEDTDAGAHICINGTEEKSDNLTGTSDWTKIEFVFNSKNRQEVQIGFRLGGNYDDTKGTAWFSDMTIEAGIADTSNEWNFLCLLFDETKVTLDVNGASQDFDLSLSDSDIYDMKLCINRFETSIEEMSNGKIKADCDIVEVKTPIKSMSYDDENGYYVSPYDIKDIIDEYIALGKYDHIFIAFRTGDINSTEEIPVNDWIGLGSMEYRNIGFSNIRLPNSASNYIYKYDTRINTFPEEVYMHEFLHTLERKAEEYGYERPELHNYEKYGYKNESLIGLKKWYTDYMNKEIKSSLGGYIGLPEEIFTKKPTKTSDFEFSRKLDYLDEPENIIQELSELINRAIKLVKTSLSA
jgi:hypothetical protein